MNEEKYATFCDTLKVAGNTSQIDLLIQDNPYRSSTWLLCRNWEPNPKIHFEKEYNILKDSHPSQFLNLNYKLQ